MRSRKWILILLPILIFIGVLSSKKAATFLLGEARWTYESLQPSNLKIPSERTIQWNKTSKFAEIFIHGKIVGEKNKIWNKDDKTGSPKTILHHLIANENIPEVNRLILSMQPWGVSGSAWLLNPNGGYNFALTPFITILYLFDDKPEILYPETKKHLLNVLINSEGGKFTDAVPGTLGRVKDSENHVLMAQGSKYLKNRYLYINGNKDKKYNNELNGMEEGILNLLKEHSELGLYEFNSVPYSAYTITPLQNLEAFGSEKVRKAAREVLDYISFTYALGSYNFKYYPPFRRRLNKHRITNLSEDYQTIFMKSWMSFHPEIKYNEPIENGKKHVLMAISLPYRPPNKAVELLFDKSPGYFVKLGHGTKSCPEIYSAGDGYLLSAGGATQGKWSIIVTRPTCLFLDDDAQDISEVIHLKGKGDNFMKWNNTGVYKDFACTNGTLFIPEKFKAVVENELWSIFKVAKNIHAAIHSSKGLNILALFKNKTPEKLLNDISKVNPELNKLQTQFQFPNGNKISYNVNAQRDKWVITDVNDIPTDRDFEKWALMSGKINN